MPIPILSVAQVREWEKATWSSSIKPEEVMRRAGEAVARLAEKMTGPNGLILFLAGKGHNGDDTALACEFTGHRRRELLRVIDPEVSGPELRSHLERKPALIVDGLFGIGLNRPLSSAWSKFIEVINTSRCPVLAVDVPSGLNADTGLPLENAVRATCTLTLAGVKRGLLATGASTFVGRLEVAPEIGLLPYPFTTEVGWLVGEDFLDYPPARPVGGHKGTFGHLVIVAGSQGFHGAAVLAARGAQRAQAGLITLCTMPGVYGPVAAQLQSVMVQTWDDESTIPKSATALLIGPGLAGRDVPETMPRAVRRLWQDSPLPLVVDASALAWVPDGPVPETTLRVVTPHPGEAAGMLRLTSADVQRDRPLAVRDLSRRFANCHVVLKGHQTVIGQGRSELFVNSSGNPYLAQGGSGDLLAGYLAGLLAQPELVKDPDQAVRYAVWQHGASADSLLGARPNFVIEDLAGVLGGVRPPSGSFR